MHTVQDQPATAAPQVWGACPFGPGHWDIALWAPSTDRLMLYPGEAQPKAMTRGADGVHRARVQANEGTHYAFSTNGAPFADPASLQQNGGVEGWSILRDPALFPSAPANGPRRAFDESVI